MAVALPFSTTKTGLARVLAQAPPLASFGLALVCGYLSARLVWALVPVSSKSSLLMQQTPNAELVTVPNAGEQIAQAHLFGEATQTPSASKPAPAALPPSHLKLLGVITGSPSFAIIENAGKQKAYALHDTIEGTNQTLAHITSKAVKLSTKDSDSLTELALPDLSKPTPASTNTSMLGTEMPEEAVVMPEEMPIEAEPVVVEEPPMVEQVPETPPEVSPPTVNTPDMILPPGSTQPLPEVEQGIVPPTLEPDVVPPTAVEPPPQ